MARRFHWTHVQVVGNVTPVPRKAPPPLDRATLEYLIAVLTQRLQAVEVYGAGGCPTCRDSELRGALHALGELAKRAALPPTR